MKDKMMKQFLLILVGNLLTFSTVLATEQEPDKLIIEKDTFYLKSFPLENLKLLKKNQISPFGGFKVSTGCWRGYIATWKVIDGFLVLIKVENYFSKKPRLNIIEYLKSNGYNPKTKNGFVLASWYTDSLVRYESPYSSAKDEEYYLSDRDFSGQNDKKVELKFENGKLITNNIIPIEAYEIGDKLSFYNPLDWKMGCRKDTIKGVIRENNGKMVRLEILSYNVDNEEKTKQVQKGTNKNLDNVWINPRYCEKIE